MTSMDRRSALALGLAAAGALSASIASTPARAGQAGPVKAPNGAAGVGLVDGSAVAFWSNVSLDLVALDHSIAAADARAPGPCATATALALAHVVVADAVKSVDSSARYTAFLKDARSAGLVSSPASFVGGAAFAILRHIYSGRAHGELLDAKQREFLATLGSASPSDWQKGAAFGADPSFTGKWDWTRIRALISPRDTTYRPGPRQHDVDPFNCDQGFYGQRWGEQPPLVLTDREVKQDLAPPPPPPEGSPAYEAALREVRAVGRLFGTAADPRRTRAQTDVGVFWAYDGARLIGTPPRLYNQIVLAVARRDGLSGPELARLLALCNLAMSDAGIVCWHAKYLWKVWRPVLGIRYHPRSPEPTWTPLGVPRTNRPYPAAQPVLSTVELSQNILGGGTTARAIAQKQACAPGLDPVYAAAAFTPNFPAYPSGHSIFGAACFDMLRRVRGERAATRLAPDRVDLDFVSDELNGTAIDNFRNEPRPRRVVRFATIEDMIRKNSDSRAYLGVHWRFDMTEGDVCGKDIAGTVHGRAYRRA